MNDERNKMRERKMEKKEVRKNLRDFKRAKICLLIKIHLTVILNQEENGFQLLCIKNHNYLLGARDQNLSFD